jgi:transcriptional regulator with XRE-family HTH domain
MRDFMPDSHIAVKPQYASRGLESLTPEDNNACMKNLREIRKARGLSQAQLAEMAGCNQATIAKIERGDANPTLSMIEDIAKALKVSPVVLFGVPDLQARAIKALEALPPERREAALVVLEAMVAQKA